MENMLSTAAELACTPKYFLANLDKLMNLDSLFFQKLKVPSNSKLLSFNVLIYSFISSSINRLPLDVLFDYHLYER